MSFFKITDPRVSRGHLEDKLREAKGPENTSEEVNAKVTNFQATERQYPTSQKGIPEAARDKFIGETKLPVSD